MANTLQYESEMCEKLVKHMAQGHSFSTFSTIAGVTRTTLYEWVDKYPEFADAKQNGEESAKKFLEKRLMAKVSGQDLSSLGIDTKKIDTACLIFALKTRFYKDYGDKSKHEVSGEIKTNVVTLDEDDMGL